MKYSAMEKLHDGSGSKKAKKSNKKLYKRYVKSAAAYQKGEVCRDNEGYIKITKISYCFSNVSDRWLFILYIGIESNKKGKLKKGDPIREIHELRVR